MGTNYPARLPRGRKSSHCVTDRLLLSVGVFTACWREKRRSECVAELGWNGPGLRTIEGNGGRTRADGNKGNPAVHYCVPLGGIPFGQRGTPFREILLAVPELTRSADIKLNQQA